MSLSLVIPCSFAKDNSEDEQVETRGIMTILQVTTFSYETTVYGEAVNTFTLGISTVRVQLYLYSSYSSTYSLSSCTLEDYVEIDDLNIGQNLTTRCQGTPGKYYYCRAVYKVDRGSFKEKVSTGLYYS